MSNLPWWALIGALLGVLIAWSFLTDQTYTVIIGRLKDGLLVTVRVTLTAYSIALVFGLILALGRIARNKIIRNIAIFYIEIMRGLPTLVLLLYVAFVLIPGFITGLNAIGAQLTTVTSLPLIVDLGTTLNTIRTRDVPNEFRVTLALILGYAAFLAEVFRAGIESVGTGQMEAARALGMGYGQAMRTVILPQAIRTALPALGNDFIAMLKDSSLASALGVEEITRLAQTYASSSFRTFETYNVLAYMYLVLTLGLSLVVKLLETRLSRARQRR